MTWRHCRNTATHACFLCVYVCVCVNVRKHVWSGACFTFPVIFQEVSRAPLNHYSRWNYGANVQTNSNSTLNEVPFYFDAKNLNILGDSGLDWSRKTFFFWLKPVLNNSIKTYKIINGQRKERLGNIQYWWEGKFEKSKIYLILICGCFPAPVSFAGPKTLDYCYQCNLI